MKFSEKLSALFSITATTNAAIARGIKVDGAQISRMKTGARGMPLKKEMIRAMSDYLARHFDGEYRISALYGLTSDLRLQMQQSTQMLSDVIFDWLTAPETSEKTPVGQIPNNPDRFFPMNRNTKMGKARNPAKPLGKESSFLSYYDNSGKRQAVRNFLGYLQSLEAPVLVRIFTDEGTDWLTRDPLFMNEIGQSVEQLAEKGHHCQSIRPPEESLDYSLGMIAQWLPAYRKGAIRQYRYAWARDGLHRRTILVVPGHIVFTAMSLAGQKESPLTMLTTDPKTVDLYNGYFDEILTRCKPSTNTIPLEDPDKVLDLMVAIEERDADGYYKFRTLSPLTLPSDLQVRIWEQATPLAEKIQAALRRRIAHRHRVLENYEITDIMSLPPIKEVLAGKTAIPATQMLGEKELFYTPREYEQHLAHILWHLETYPHYTVVLSQDPTLESMVLYAKSDERVFVIKDDFPTVALAITDPTLAASFYEYLRHLAQRELGNGGKEQVMARLREEIVLLQRAIADTTEG